MQISLSIEKVAPDLCIAVIEDITERKRAENELQFQSELMMNIAEAVFLIRLADGVIVYTNPVFALMFGYRENEMLGKHASIVNAPTGADPEATAREIMAVAQEQGSWQGDVENIRKDGSRFWCEAHVSTFDHSRFGRVLVAVHTDITERVHANEEKARLEEQLRQAQKMEAIGRLAGGVAHDFNNITAIVLGYAEMLLGGQAPGDPSRKFTEQIIKAGERSAALTRQLLAFSRKQTLQPVVLDINELLRNLEMMLGRAIGEDVELRLELSADPGLVTADPGQLEQVVTNLVINARDAMPHGGRLTVETADVELDEKYARDHAGVAPGKYVQLAVTDTGCGMDKATMAHLFEPFFTTKEKGKGTGLGLATVHGIVKQSGGHIWAYSEPLRGTTFKIYLPRAVAQPAAPVVDSEGEVARAQGELILLVEDEAPLRELCETTLAQLGYRVTGAENGPDALRLVLEQRLRPDLLFTDVIMPGMDGPELPRRLRTVRPGLPVLYMSGYPDEAIARHGVLDPGINFLQKPFSARALATKMREALAGAVSAALPGRNVLMIDDDEQFRELVQRFCTKAGHPFSGVDSAAAALAALFARPADVLLIDQNIPGTSGVQVLRAIRAAGHTTPAVVLSGEIASVDMDALRPLGVVLALEKSSEAGPVLQAIATAGAIIAPPRESDAI